MGGASCEIDFSSFPERVRKGIGQICQFTEVTFEGGITATQLESLVKGLPDNVGHGLHTRLKAHVHRSASNELSTDRGASIESYSESEAERWIAEYDEALQNTA